MYAHVPHEQLGIALRVEDHGALGGVVPRRHLHRPQALQRQPRSEEVAVGVVADDRQEAGAAAQLAKGLADVPRHSAGGRVEFGAVEPSVQLEEGSVFSVSIFLQIE